MKLFGKKNDEAPEAVTDAETTDMGEGAHETGAQENFDAGLDEIEGAQGTELSAPSRKFGGGGGSKKNLMVLGGLVLVAVLGAGGYFYMNSMSSDTPPLNVAAATPPQPEPAPATPAAAVPPQPAPAPAADPLAPAPATPAIANPLGAPPADEANALPAATVATGAAAPAPGTVPATMPAATPEEGAPDMPPSALTTPAGPNGAAPATAAEQQSAQMEAKNVAAGAAPSVPGTTPEQTAALAEAKNIAAGAAPATAGADLPLPTDANAPKVPLANGTPAAAPAAAGTPASVNATLAAGAKAEPAAEAAPAWATPGAAPAPGTAAPAGAKATTPTDAELAIVQNAAVIDQLSQPAKPAAAKPATAPTGAPFDPNAPKPQVSDSMKTVEQLLETPAIIRPVPNGYVTVRKESDAGDIDSRLSAARTALAENRNAAALQLFDDLHQTYPKDKRIMMGRAVSLQKMGQTDDALAAYEDVLNRDPKNVQALTNMLGLLKVKDPQLALEKLQQLHDAYPYQADITAQLGVAYASTGAYPEAAKYLDMADSLKPGSAYVMYNRAVLYDKMGRSKDAGFLYRQIIRMSADGTLDQQLPIDIIRRRLSTLQ